VTATTALPAPADVAERARQIHAAWQADAEMKTVLDGCAKYNADWDDFYGGPLSAPTASPATRATSSSTHCA
jgi:hypothetical protein